MTGLFWLLVLALVAWTTLESWRALDRARVVVARVCEKSGVQLLDQSVAHTAVKLSRSGLIRRFRFEFSESGVDRRQGWFTLVGGQPGEIVLDRLAGREFLRWGE